MHAVTAVQRKYIKKQKQDVLNMRVDSIYTQKTNIHSTPYTLLPSEPQAYTKHHAESINNK